MNSRSWREGESDTGGPNLPLFCIYVLYCMYYMYVNDMTEINMAHIWHHLFLERGSWPCRGYSVVVHTSVLVVEKPEI